MLMATRAIDGQAFDADSRPSRGHRDRLTTERRESTAVVLDCTPHERYSGSSAHMAPWMSI